MTPKRPDATCLTAERLESPLGRTSKRIGSSPPSPVFDLAPSRFMAMARVSWASAEMEPYDMAPVEKRRTISLIGSTSSRGTAGRTPVFSSKSPRSVASCRAWSSTLRVYSLKTS